MIDKSDIENLSKLARIELNEEEKKSLTKDIDNILSFVEQIKEVLPAQAGSADLPEIPEVQKLRNVLREDENPHESGVNTKELLEGAPETEGEYIKVQKIL